MSSLISKNLPNILVITLMTLTLFVSVFRIIAVQSDRDAAGVNIRRMELRMSELKKEIQVQQSYRDQISNATTLRRSREVRDNFNDIDDSHIIRVRTMKVPYGRSETIVADPRASALDLAMLTSRYSATDSRR